MVHQYCADIEKWEELQSVLIKKSFILHGERCLWNSLCLRVHDVNVCMDKYFCIKYTKQWYCLGNIVSEQWDYKVKEWEGWFKPPLIVKYNFKK